MSDSKKINWGSFLASSLLSALLGYFLPKALDGALPWLSENPLSQYPMETVGIAVSASLIGFLAGNRFGRKAPRTKTKRPSKAEIERRNNEVLAANRQVVMRLDATLKAICKGALFKGAAYCRTGDWTSAMWGNEEHYSQFFDWENLDRGRTKLTPSEQLKEIVKVYPDLFDGISDEMMAEYALYDPDEQLTDSRYIYGGGLVWWWYSHDPETDRRKQHEPLDPWRPTQPQMVSAQAVERLDSGRPSKHELEVAETRDHIKRMEPDTKEFLWLVILAKEQGRSIATAYRKDILSLLGKDYVTNYLDHTTGPNRSCTWELLESFPEEITSEDTAFGGITISSINQKSPLTAEIKQGLSTFETREGVNQ